MFDLTIKAIYDRWGHLFTQLQDQAILPKMQIFCQAVRDRSIVVPRVGSSQIEPHASPTILVQRMET